MHSWAERVEASICEHVAACWAWEIARRTLHKLCDRWCMLKAFAYARCMAWHDQLRGLRDMTLHIELLRHVLRVHDYKECDLCEHSSILCVSVLLTR